MNTINGVEIKTIEDLAGFASVTSLVCFGQSVEINGVVYSNYEGAHAAFAEIVKAVQKNV